MSKTITDDCIKSFITNHYGTTDISTIGDGTVTGAISSLNTNLANMNDGNYRHIKVVTATVSTDLADLGASYGALRYYKMFTVDWNSYLPTGKVAKEVIFSHVTISGYNGEYATCTPYLKNGDTASQQKLPTQWALWCSKNAYCYPTFFILY